MPTRFAEWLQKALLDNFGLVTELNDTKTGLISKSVQNVTNNQNTQSTPTFTATQLWYVNKAAITSVLPDMTLDILKDMEEEQGIKAVIDFIKTCKGVKI